MNASPTWTLLALMIISGPLEVRAQALLYCPGPSATREDVAASYEGTDATGPVFSCQNVASAVCVDLGPGSHNNLCTNVSGEILLGCGSTSTIIRVGEGTIIQNGQITIPNGAINADGTVIRNNAGGQGGTVHIEDAQGLMVNSTTPIKGVLLLPVTVNLGDLTDQCDDVTATVAGVEANDYVFVTPNGDLAAANIIVGNARVTNAGTDEVTFRACDVANGSDDPASASFLFLVMRP
jgi:hypothetical protein